MKIEVGDELRVDKSVWKKWWWWSKGVYAVQVLDRSGTLGVVADNGCRYFVRSLKGLDGFSFHKKIVSLENV